MNVTDSLHVASESWCFQGKEYVADNHLVLQDKERCEEKNSKTNFMFCQNLTNPVVHINKHSQVVFHWHVSKLEKFSSSQIILQFLKLVCI